MWCGAPPPPFNVQPWRFVVVEMPEVKGLLAAAAYHQRQIGSARAVAHSRIGMCETLAREDVNAASSPMKISKRAGRLPRSGADPRADHGGFR